LERNCPANASSEEKKAWITVLRTRGTTEEEGRGSVLHPMCDPRKRRREGGNITVAAHNSKTELKVCEKQKAKVAEKLHRTGKKFLK